MKASEDGFLTEVAGLQIRSPIGIGAGKIKYMDGPEGLAAALETGVGLVTVGSYTVNDSPGNSGNVFDHDNTCSLNSMGLPGPGIERQREILPPMVALAKEKSVPIIYSAAGNSPDDYVRLAELAVELGFDGIEYNLGCPNKWGEGGKQNPIASYDPDVTHAILSAVETEIGTVLPGFAKISPFPPIILAKVVPVLVASRLIDVWVATNAGPNGRMFNAEGNSWVDATSPAGAKVIYGGIAGPALKPWSLGVVSQLSTMRSEHVQIIGVGGIESGQDILDYMKAGAVFTEAVTVFSRKDRQGFREVTRILTEYADLTEVAA